MFNRNLNLTYLRIKHLVQPKILCRQLSVPSIKYQNYSNTHCKRIQYITGNHLFHDTNTTSTGRFLSWKWLLAISLLYAGYDGQNIFDIINQGSAEELTKFLKDNPKAVNKIHLFGWAPIHVAASNNKYEHLAVLLKSGADPDLSDGFSNCINVARKRNINPSDVLSIRENHFMHNLNVNATFQGFTAFHYAALLNNIESLKILMDHGADPLLKSVTGHKPIDLVTDLTIYELLADYEKNVDFNVLVS